jgi:hypothetical protein
MIILDAVRFLGFMLAIFAMVVLFREAEDHLEQGNWRSGLLCILLMVISFIAAVILVEGGSV